MFKNRRSFLKSFGLSCAVLPGVGALAAVKEKTPKYDFEDGFGFNVGDTVYIGSYLIIKDKKEIHIYLEEFKVYEVSIKKVITEKETTEMFDGCWGRPKKGKNSIKIDPGGLVKKTISRTLERVNEHLDFMTECYHDHEWLTEYKRIVIK